MVKKTIHLKEVIIMKAKCLNCENIIVFDSYLIRATNIIHEMYPDQKISTLDILDMVKKCCDNPRYYHEL